MSLFLWGRVPAGAGPAAAGGADSIAHPSGRQRRQPPGPRRMETAILPVTRRFPMRNPLQDQLLKAGLVKKSKVAEVVREQAKQRKGKGHPKGDAGQTPGTPVVDTQRLKAEKAQADRELAAQRNAQARARELRAQAQQLVEAHRVATGGDIAYRFQDGELIRQLWVDAGTRAQLSRGSLLIVRDGDGHAVVPRAAAERIRERDPSMIVLDHAADADGPDDDEDPYYAQFKVPDDLDW